VNPINDIPFLTQNSPQGGEMIIKGIFKLFKKKKKSIDEIYQNMNIPDKKPSAVPRDLYFEGHGIIIRFP